MLEELPAGGRMEYLSGLPDAERIRAQDQLSKRLSPWKRAKFLASLTTEDIDAVNALELDEDRYMDSIEADEKAPSSHL